MKTGPQSIDWDDIQCIALSGIGQHPESLHLFLRVTDQTAAKAWLQRLLDGGHVPSAAAIDDRTSSGEVSDLLVCIALSAAGLRALGLDAETLQTFPFEFQEGMAGTQRRREMLGDVGPNAPDTWIWGHGEREPHLVMMIFASDGAHLEPKALWKLLPALDGLENVWGAETCSDVYTPDGLRTYLRSDHKEHFGYRDGISQPLIEGTRAAEGRRYGPEEISIIKAGELVLGYKNERGLRPVSPLVSADRTGASGLPRYADGLCDLGANGSFLVVRQLSQDVAAFDSAIADLVETPADADRLKARLMGRWPNGASLVRHPVEAPDESETWRPENDFLYDLEDRSGLKCPVGSHIRRANPRDSLPPDPETALRLSKRRRILRRGRLYGAAYSDKTKECPRGILFICLNADIADQFELIQHSWLNNPHFADLYDESDPIAATRRPLGQRMTVQANPINIRTSDLGRFVGVEGGAYFFLPGLKALRFLAGGLGDVEQVAHNG